MRRLNYNKTIFMKRSHHTSESDVERRGYFLPIILPLSPRDPSAPRSPSELVPPLFDTEVTPLEPADPDSPGRMPSLLVALKNVSYTSCKRKKSQE